MLGEMPPEEARKQPPQERTAALIRWLAGEIAKIDRVVMAGGGQPLLATLPRLDRPIDGNLIPHDLLFHPKPGTHPDAPARIVSAWGPGKKLPTQCHPDLAWNALFGAVATGETRAQHIAERNVLDFIAEDARRIETRLDPALKDFDQRGPLTELLA